MKQGSWKTSARPYVLSAIESGWLSPGTASNLLGSYFYLTHGIFVLDLAMACAGAIIASLGPLRNRRSLADSPKSCSRKPAAALHEYRVESGEDRRRIPYSLGGRLYRLRGRWSGYLHFDLGICRRLGCLWIQAFGFGDATLLLTFILASILLSVVQGPLGVANSALVLLSMVIVGIAVDFRSLSSRERRAAPEPRASRSGQVSAS